MMQSRQTFVFSGETDWVIAQANRQIALANNEDTLWVSSLEPDHSNCTCLPHTKVRTILGGEFNVIVYDALDGFYPDAFGAVTGTLRAGGILLLLMPDFSSINSRFMQRLVQIIHDDKSIEVITEDNLINNKALKSASLLHLRDRETIHAYSPPCKRGAEGEAKSQYYLAKDSPLSRQSSPQSTSTRTTADQQLAITAIEKVVTGHRRRPLVLTADRGRGKSAALGIAAKKLLAKKLQTIIVTAPAKKSAGMVFKHADDAEGLIFIAPDELIQTLPKTDLLLIDEAAAIPAPLLTKLLKHYSRIVFSTTQHGYEGTGRGFDIRFKQVLNKQTPDWKSLRLETPIRWSENDPLEQFVFKALLLNADQSRAHSTKLTHSIVEKISRDKLLEDEKLLSQLFGLLVTAHYQTKPSDLQYLLNDKAVSIYIIKQNNHVTATALTVTEGGFDSDLAQKIYAGERRPKGHLIPQSLAFHSGIKDAALLIGERIIRIAVHSELQRQGLATQLIQYIQQDSSDKDYIGASFAATTDMLQFWDKQKFKTVRLGLTRDASSGTHSVIELLPLSEQGKVIFQQLRKQFQYTLPHLLSEPLRELEAKIIEPLFKTNQAINIQLEDWQWQELRTFATTHRGYEVCMASLWEWLVQFIVTEDLTKLKPIDRSLLIAKILQKRTWKELTNSFEFTGKKEAQARFKAAIYEGLLR